MQKVDWNIVNINKKEQFKRLYDEDAITIEGLNAEDDTWEGLINFFKEHEAIDDNVKLVIFAVITGEDMNKEYKLTGENAYPDGLTIVCVPLSQFKRGFVQKIAIPMRSFGGRWFSDVVDNNSRRQKEINRS